jgi:predicted peptidase
VEKYGTDRQAIDENIKQHMRFACWITKAIDTHSEYVILIVFFHGNSSYMNGPQCYATRTSPVFLKFI